MTELILILILGILIIGTLVILISSDNIYTGGHAAGKVHHRRSWEEYPESDKEYKRWKMCNKHIL